MERLIESVRQYPCLWKLDSEEYKLNDLKAAAWKEVIKECDLPDVQEARSQCKKLRDGHRQALSRKKTVTGQAATSKSLWKYEKQMEFLLPYLQNRQRLTNVVSQEVSQPEQNNNRNETAIKENESHQNENEDSSDTVVDQVYGDLVPSRKKATLVSLLEKEQRRKEQRSVERDTLRKQILNSSPKPKPETAIEKFYMSMMLTTQTLPERLQLRVQRQVFNVVMEAKEEYLATHASNSIIHSATNVYNLRGDTPFQLPIPGSSRSDSSISNYENSNLYTSPSQSNPPTPQESYIITTANIEQLADTNFEDNM